MENIQAVIARFEGVQLAHRLFIALLIDRLTIGLPDQIRTAEIGVMFNAANDAIDLAIDEHNGNGTWVLAQARKEVNDITGRLLAMEPDSEG